ncbi:MAG: aminoacyl-tRNA hydrolase [Bacteroidetes bacterium]|nr:peptidyl-tRNA hydrolase [Rhodothermaceae bacterium RA]RMH70306.1 MAG: aminoacyl-tRNA hydrolase [Bacteroidota bacterium]
MARGKRLIVGLGNPGPEYARTRHNAGFLVADAVAEQARASFALEKGNALVAWGQVRGRPVGIAKPQTYMNRSGAAVRNLVGRYGLDLDQVLVVYDDLNLPLGTVRLRPGGSAGGHNGVQSIIDELGSDAFPRLRIGIGSDFPRGGQVDYVLSPFEADEEPLVEEAVALARDAAVTFVCDGLAIAMNRYNRKTPRRSPSA